MEASVGIRARPGAWAGLEKPRGAYSARVPAARLTAEKLPPRLALGTDLRRSADPALRAAKLKASCCKKSAGTVLKRSTTLLMKLSYYSDKLVEKAVGISSVAEIFQLHSEAFFRDNESEVLRDLSSMHRLVVATGGGAVIRPINWSYMKKGLTVWLDVPLDALARRIAAVGTASRPLLHQESGDPYAKAYAKLTSLFEQRMDSYANADARVSLEHIALKQGHNDVTILTPSTIAIEALLKMESFLTEKAMVRN
ncbi:shikimate kinase 3, chloroplastic [Panicum miliaceum]|uniref:shikimate kinase n=1 Tax=Panicum miliaceum TaxID=4540 RepID=A0A3L6Q3E1_PANMI|nr:shikimate kinase 3, chloroplastic [Panicum miliaceum]